MKQYKSWKHTFHATHTAAFKARATILCGICVLFLMCGFAYGQYTYTFVTNANSYDATSFNNSHKIALLGESPMADTICIVYHDNDSVMFTQSTNTGGTWGNPVALGPGHYPGIDIDAYGFRHVVWEQIDTMSGTTDIMYDCLDDYGPPVNISESAGNSMFADVVVDDSLTAHIVWVENIGAANQIMYRPSYAGSLGTIEQVSPSWPHATHTFPSISIHDPGFRVYVVWDCIDTSSYSPYQILYRYKTSSWSTCDWIYASHLQAGHSSIDYDHGVDALSCCYDYETASGDHDADFYGGNGGGYATSGESMYPVITTIGDVWSYLFWQEDSNGYEDIYYHLYYFMTGWVDGSVRSLFSIDEPVRFPNSCGAYLTWTQGETSPYSIYFADFGYPVSTADQNSATCPTLCSISPNPFREKTSITYSVERNAQCSYIKIYDVTGHAVKTFPHFTHGALRNTLTWDGTDNNGKSVPAGSYFIVIPLLYGHSVHKIVKLE